LGELGVSLILARSPRAKGRVERLWGTFQDRLVSELRLAKAGTAGDANQVLERSLPRHNRRFMVAAQDPDPAWLPWPKNRRFDQVFCFKYRRVVGNDNTVRFAPHQIDIPRSRDRTSHALARVEVDERFDGTLCIFAAGVCLAKKVMANGKTLYRVADQSAAPRPRARPQHVEAQGSQASKLDTLLPRCQAPLAPHPRTLTMTNSLNRCRRRSLGATTSPALG
jgi:hypothetical protein